MDIAVVGCGAMGSIYAGLLASAGHRVIAVDTNEAHVAAINGGGLRVSDRQEPVLTAGGREMRNREATAAFIELGWRF